MKKVNQVNPTKQTYDALNKAYEFFNKRLFGSGLPPCLVTLQRRNRAFGYFWGERFGTRDGKDVTDEIALNPRHFQERTVEQTLSTLVHEMVHLWQHHFGKPSRSAYHNKQWAAKMKAVGLYPSTTGTPGGRETGQTCSHYILKGDRFSVACAELLKAGCDIAYVEVVHDEAEAKRKRETKTKFTCHGTECGGLNAWAKADAKLTCTECGLEMVAED